MITLPNRYRARSTPYDYLLLRRHISNDIIGTLDIHLSIKKNLRKALLKTQQRRVASTNKTLEFPDTVMNPVSVEEHLEND